jgi:hypothetical protein
MRPAYSLDPEAAVRNGVKIEKNALLPRVNNGCVWRAPWVKKLLRLASAFRAVTASACNCRRVGLDGTDDRSVSGVRPP